MVNGQFASQVNLIFFRNLKKQQMNLKKNKNVFKSEPLQT